MSFNPGRPNKLKKLFSEEKHWLHAVLTFGKSPVVVKLTKA